MTTSARGPLPKKGPPPNKPSNLLNNEENATVYKLLGDKCKTMSTSVVQLFLALPESRTKWSKKHCGVCCLVRDAPKQSYFVRIYNILNNSMLWEQEIYNDFKYITPRPKFHTFAGDNCQVALNFSNQEEADHFKTAVLSKIHEKHEKRKSRLIAPAPMTLAVDQDSSVRPPVAAASLPGNNNRSPISNSLPVRGSMKPNSKDKKKRKPITKADIGKPSNFEHVGHVGWNPDEGFQMNNLDPDLEQLFESIGLTDNDLKDSGVTETIYKVLQKHGGVEAVRKENQMRQTSTLLPPPSSRGGGRKNPPPPPGRSPGPPPGRPNRGPAAPPPPPSSGGRRAAAPPPAAGPAPPPPPPPPIGAGAPPPPPPPPPGPGLPPAPSSLSATDGRAPPPPPSGGGRGALLDAITKGKPLNAVGPNQQAAPTSGRGQLLSEIVKKPILKPVEANTKPAAPEFPAGGIACALLTALSDRYKDIQSDDDSSEDEWSDDD